MENQEQKDLKSLIEQIIGNDTIIAKSKKSYQYEWESPYEWEAKIIAHFVEKGCGLEDIKVKHNYNALLQKSTKSTMVEIDLSVSTPHNEHQRTWSLISEDTLCNIWNSSIQISCDVEFSKEENQLIADLWKTAESLIPQEKFAYSEEVAAKLTEEVKVLFRGEGEEFIDGDYYAPDRVYSKIEGVKNIRQSTHEGWILVKLYYDVPLPREIVVEGQKYRIKTFYSQSR